MKKDEKVVAYTIVDGTLHETSTGNVVGQLTNIPVQPTTLTDAECGFDILNFPILIRTKAPFQLQLILHLFYADGDTDIKTVYASVDGDEIYTVDDILTLNDLALRL